MYYAGRSGECSEEGDLLQCEGSGVKTRSLEELKWHFGRKLRDLSSPDDPTWRGCTALVDPVNAQRRVTFFRREDSGVKTRSLEELKWYFGRKLHDLSSPDDPMRRGCTTLVDPVKSQG